MHIVSKLNLRGQQSLDGQWWVMVIIYYLN